MQFSMTLSSSQSAISHIAQGTSSEVEHGTDYIRFSGTKVIITDCSPLIVVKHLHPSHEVNVRMKRNKSYWNIGLPPLINILFK